MVFFFYAVMPFIIGAFIGSFLNVVIIRSCSNESFVKGRSHCMTCGETLKWYHMVPILSWLFLRGKCGYCKAKISFQYPLVELLNGLAWAASFYCLNVTFDVDGPTFELCTLKSLLALAVASVLIVISGIDIKIYEIPYTLNFILLGIGIITVATDWENKWLYLIGMFSVGGFLLLLQVVSRGRAIGGGDVFLMISAGLILGWKNVILAFVLGCIIGSVIHLALMKVKKNTDNVLPFGPYLSVGIFAALIFGDKLVDMYLKLLGF